MNSPVMSPRDPSPPGVAVAKAAVAKKAVPRAPGGPPRARVARAPSPAIGPSPRAKATAILAAPVSWLTVFLLIPLVLVALVGFATVQANYLLSFERLTFVHYQDVLNPAGEPFRLLWRSLWISFAATAMSLFVGYAVAYYIARMVKEKWKGFLMALVVIPFWITFIVRIYGLILFVRLNGFIDLFFRNIGLAGVGTYFVSNFGLGTDALLVFTLVYVWLPFMVLPLFTSLSKIDPQLLEAASDLGASRLRAFWNVTLPLSLPGIITGSIFVFITALGSFVEPDFLSASPMIGNYVQTQFGGTQGVGVPLGAAASVFIIVSTMLLVTVYSRYAEMEASGVLTAARKPTGWRAGVRPLVLVVGLVALASGTAYVLIGALSSGSVGGGLDTALLLVLLLLFEAYAIGEILTAIGRTTPERARLETTNGIAGMLIAAGAWTLGRAVLYAYDVGGHGLSFGNAPELLLLALASAVAAVVLFDAGAIIYRNRRKVATQPPEETIRLLTEGEHPLGRMVVGGTRVLDRVAERHGRRVLAGVTAVTLLIFFVPLILMSLFSFTAGFNPSAWEGFSLRWYVGGGEVERDALFRDAAVLNSLAVSVIVGLASAFLSLVLGLLAAFAVDRYAFRGKAALNNVMYLGLVIPSIVMGISLSILVRLTNDAFLAPNALTWEFGILSLIIGHTTFNIPLATLVLLISFREFDRSLEEAAMNLGAGPFTTFFRVTLPNIKAGVVSTILLTFTFSFDEFPVSLFLAGSNPTYPIVAWGLLSKKIPTPEANAAATLILAISLVFVLLATKVQKGGTIFRI